MWQITDLYGQSFWAPDPWFHIKFTSFILGHYTAKAISSPSILCPSIPIVYLVLLYNIMVMTMLMIQRFWDQFPQKIEFLKQILKMVQLDEFTNSILEKNYRDY